MSHPHNLMEIVLAVYDPRGTYSQHAGVVMTSIFENTQSPVCVHILHDETLTAENRRRLQQIAETYGKAVNFVDAGASSLALGQEALALAEGEWSIGSLFRLLIPELLPSLKKVIYLDCDIIVNLDVRELWDVPLEDCSLAGVLDHSTGKSNRRFSCEALRTRLIGCSLPRYINSGVLVMRLDRIRERYDLIGEALRWFSDNAFLAALPDQDFLNALFCGDIKLIDYKFNNRNLDGPTEGSIMHAIRSPKPWAGLRGTPTEKLYWKMYLKTPWGANLTTCQTAEILIGLVENSPESHRHTAQSYRRIGKRLWRDVFCNDLFSSIALLSRTVFYRFLGRMRRFTPTSRKARTQ